MADQTGNVVIGLLLDVTEPANTAPSYSAKDARLGGTHWIQDRTSAPQLFRGRERHGRRRIVA